MDNRAVSCGTRRTGGFDNCPRLFANVTTVTVVEGSHNGGRNSRYRNGLLDGCTRVPFRKSAFHPAQGYSRGALQRLRNRRFRRLCRQGHIGAGGAYWQSSSLRALADAVPGREWFKRRPLFPSAQAGARPRNTVPAGTVVQQTGSLYRLCQHGLYAEAVVGFCRVTWKASGDRGRACHKTIKQSDGVESH